MLFAGTVAVAREIERHRLCAGRADVGIGGRSDEPVDSSTIAALKAGRMAPANSASRESPAMGSVVASSRVLPLPRRSARGCRGGWRRPYILSRAVRCARRGHRRGPTRAGLADGLHRHEAFQALMQSAGPFWTTALAVFVKSTSF